MGGLGSSPEAHFDDRTNNVALIAEPREFKDVHYRAHVEAFGRGKPSPNATPAAVRRNDDDDDDGENKSNEYTKQSDIDINVKVPEFGLTLGRGSDVLKSLTGTKPPVVTIACVNCSIHGGLDVDVNVHADMDSETKLTGGMTLSARDVGASLSFRLSDNSVLKDSLNIENAVAGFVPPGMGLYFGKITRPQI